jgi:hypothetical protein
MRSPVDHLVYGAPSLERGMDEIERLLGVRPAPGGKHVGIGTHNALLSLEFGAYLEVIAPDPEQPPPSSPLPFGLATLSEPRLITWAVSVTGIEERVAAARAAGYDPGGVVPMGRRLPDGSELRWRLALRPEGPGDGIVPFLIEWEPGPSHPSRAAPAGGRLINLEAEHSHPETLQPIFDALEIDLPLTEAARPALIATIEAAGGTVVLT